MTATENNSTIHSINSSWYYVPGSELIAGSKICKSSYVIEHDHGWKKQVCVLRCQTCKKWCIEHVGRHRAGWHVWLNQITRARLFPWCIWYFVQLKIKSVNQHQKCRLHAKVMKETLERWASLQDTFPAILMCGSCGCFLMFLRGLRNLHSIFVVIYRWSGFIALKHS